MNAPANVTMMYVLGRQSHNELRDGILKLLNKAGLLSLSIPDKPRSNEAEIPADRRDRQTQDDRTGGE